jgi:hypothetical protein
VSSGTPSGPGRHEQRLNLSTVNSPPNRSGFGGDRWGYLDVVSDHDQAQPTRPHRVRWDDVDGRRVRSLEAGCAHPAVAPVVLMPGLGALGYLRDTLYGCAARSRSLLVDLPGFGYRGPRPCEPG